MATYLHRTQTAGTNTKIWTFSTWLKKASVSNDQVIFKSYSSASDYIYLRFNSNNDMYMESTTGGSSTISFTTNRKFRDISGWMHICLKVDMTQATSTDRWKLFINGVDEASVGGYSSSNYASQNDNLEMNTVGAVMYIGANQSPSEYFYGAHAHTHLSDGTAYDASAFGETDSTSGIWIPKTSPSITYGNNGFFLKYASGASGTDSSGEGNNMTVVGNLTNNKDNPDNNFCTLTNIACDFNAGGTFSNGNTKWVSPTDGNHRYVISSQAMVAGLWYMEVKMKQANDSGVGITDKEQPDGSENISQTNYGAVYKSSDGYYQVNGGSSTAYGDSYTTDDIIGIYLDLTANKLYFAKNGTIQNSGTGIDITGISSMTSPSNSSQLCYFFGFDKRNGGSTFECNFGNGYFGTDAISGAVADAGGEGQFKYNPSTGTFDGSSKDFRAFCTKNIATYG